MIRKKQFVLNSPHWSSNGFSVCNGVSIKTIDGLLLNAQSTGEAPLVVPPVCNVGKATPTENFVDEDLEKQRRLFGRTSCDCDLLPRPTINFSK